MNGTVTQLKESKPPLSRTVLRNLLRDFLRTDGDLDAFCLDYFPSAYTRFSRGMDRQSKVNLLLELEELNNIWNSLSSYRGIDSLEISQEYVKKSSMETPQNVLKQSLRDELEQIYQQRAIFRHKGSDTKLLDEKIIHLKRALRQGVQLNEGEVLGDRYRLLEVCGRGGFAKVWQAYDRDVRQLVAIKVLHGDQAEDPRCVERFARGARLLRSINHPNIIRIFSDSAIDNGFVYYVMEFLSGGDFHHAVTEGHFDLRRSLEIILEIAKALEHMHRSGLIHRDVKPQNILLDGAGGARLSDFDLAWASDTTGGTRTCGLGTFVYAAPEAMEDASRVDPRADVFSISMTGVFAVLGRSLPRQALQNSARFLRSIDCPGHIRAVLQRGIGWDPTTRYQSMAEFCTALEEAIGRTFDIPPDSSDKEALDLSQPIFRLTEGVSPQSLGMGDTRKGTVHIVPILLIATTMVIPGTSMKSVGDSSASAKPDKPTLALNAPRELPSEHGTSPPSPLPKKENLAARAWVKRTPPPPSRKGPPAMPQRLQGPQGDGGNKQYSAGSAVTEQEKVVTRDEGESWWTVREPVKIEVHPLSVNDPHSDITIFDTYRICVTKNGWLEQSDINFIAGQSSALPDRAKIQEQTKFKIIKWLYKPQNERKCYDRLTPISITYVPR